MTRRTARCQLHERRDAYPGTSLCVECINRLAQLKAKRERAQHDQAQHTPSVAQIDGAGLDAAT